MPLIQRWWPWLAKQYSGWYGDKTNWRESIAVRLTIIGNVIAGIFLLGMVIVALMFETRVI